MAPLVKETPPTDEDIDLRVSRANASEAVKARLRERFKRMFAENDLYENDVYLVMITQRDCPAGMIHLEICRKDNEPVRSWPALQRIKNELVGPECEGVELFPAESRLIDTVNAYHLWVYTDTKDRFPFEIKGRAV
jgi:hypothetical protein